MYENGRIRLQQDWLTIKYIGKKYFIIFNSNLRCSLLKSPTLSAFANFQSYFNTFYLSNNMSCL
jgi:hypothetical protein